MSLHVPDVTAFRLDFALKQLEGLGLNYYLKKTTPSHKKFEQKKPVDCLPPNYRVIKQVMRERVIELLVAPEMNGINE